MSSASRSYIKKWRKLNNHVENILNSVENPLNILQKTQKSTKPTKFGKIISSMYYTFFWICKASIEQLRETLLNQIGTAATSSFTNCIRFACFHTFWDCLKRSWFDNLRGTKKKTKTAICFIQFRIVMPLNIYVAFAPPKFKVQHNIHAKWTRYYFNLLKADTDYSIIYPSNN